jgi:hypothetical protein
MNSGYSDENRGFLNRTIERRPLLLGMTGWCGGTAFHKTAQLGYADLLSDLVSLS